MAGTSGQIDINQFEILRVIPLEALKLENEAQEIASAGQSLGYAPAFLPFILDPVTGQYQAANNVLINHTTGLVDLATNFFVTDDSVVMEIVTPATSSLYSQKVSVTAKVYLLRETAALQ